MTDSNCQTYGSPQTVNFYREQADLQLAEKSILSLISNRLSQMRMLDMGVGGGRTTLHFGHLVKDYVGIDYSQSMIRACHERFSNPGISWKVCDARDMAVFKDGEFDFILFSYNGIDYVSPEDRKLVFKEITRLLSVSGVFCFSTHNIFYLENYLKIPRVKNPLYGWRLLQRYWQIRNLLKVDKTFTHTRGAVIKDGGENFRVKTYYSHPQNQLDELRQWGFRQIRVFRETDGVEIQDFNDIQAVKSQRWFYFLCLK
ncbi:MAG: class I SAM-dependent methyltransferase [Candidatus Omnitrophica bacterium]|nr:class I SAM-dependent methyltransferase [Candidatus Omnitrophota bacterium]